MFYNVFIEHPGDKRQYAIVLDREQLTKLVNAFLAGERSVRIKGVERNIYKPEKFIIYSITDTSLGTTQAEVERNLTTHKSIVMKNKLSLGFYKMFGTNVTDSFTGGKDWGAGVEKAKDDNREEQTSSVKGKIFISHSSKDKVLVDKFIDHVLILGMNLKRESIFCTSVHGSDIRSGIDFKKAIYDELVGANAVIQIITHNYKSSEVCLNEMGAAWVIAPLVIPLVAAPFSYDVGFIHASNQQLKLNDENDIVKLYDDHKGSAFPIGINTSNLLKQIRIFKEFAESYTPSQQNGSIEKRFFYSEVNTVKGVLREGMFGHPFGAKFEKSASFHRYYYLELDPPIDVLPDMSDRVEEGNANVAYFKQSEIHIVPISEIEKEYDLKKFKDKVVEVQGEFWGSHTGWHRTKVMMNFSKIQVLG